jgi:hypothetical protein
MPRNPFDAIEADRNRLLSAFSDEEVIACRRDFSRRMKRIVAQPVEGLALTDQGAIERYGTSALVLRALLRGRDDPLWSVDMTGEVSVVDQILG